MEKTLRVPLYPLARTGSNGNVARDKVAEAPPPPLSPMRVGRAEALSEYLHERGNRLLIERRHYRELEKRGVPPHAVDQAIEDLYAHGLADVHMAGGMPVVRLTRWWCRLSESMGGAA